MLASAGMMVIAALITFLSIRGDVLGAPRAGVAAEPERHTHCAVDAPPLEPGKAA
jgi:hypothetical protein